MRECFFAHLEGKKALTEQAKRKELEEQREREIFNEHKLGILKIIVGVLLELNILCMKAKTKLLIIPNEATNEKHPRTETKGKTACPG